MTDYSDIVTQLYKELPILEQRIVEALRRNPKGITRRELVLAVYGRKAEENINNDADDRKVRMAIESMRKKFVPIISTSGKAGYRLDESKTGAEAMLAENNSRIAKLNEQNKAIRQFYKLPEPKQQSLFGEM